MRTLCEADEHLDGLTRDAHIAVRTGPANSLPAHVLLVDTQGRSIPVNDSERQLDCFNPLIDTHYGRAPDLQESDEPGDGGIPTQIHRVAAGVRSVLTGRAARYSCEYVCRSNVEERWYLVTVTPLNEEYPTAALVMYLDITGERHGGGAERRSGAGTDAMTDGILLISRLSMRCVHVNDAACRMLNRSREQLLALDPGEYLGKPATRLEDLYDALIATGIDAGPAEILHPRTDGSMVWMEVRRRAQYTGDGWTILTFVRDVTERKIAENRIACLNRVHAMLSRMNSLIVHEQDRATLLKRACRIAVEDGGLKLSMMALVDRGSMRFVPVGLASKNKKLLNAVKSALVADRGSPTAMIKLAVRDKRPVISNDSQHDPNVAYPKLHVDFDVRSMTVFPLVIGGEVMGVLSLYADECQFFHEEEIKLLTQLTNDVAFAIDHIEKQERLEYLACYDELTGLANRSLFMDRLNRMQRNAARAGQSLALLVFDLQGFRNVNDSLGRPVGDALLRQVGAWLTCNVAAAKLLARIGVDHFAVVLPNVLPEDDLPSFIEQLLGSFVAHRFVLDGTEFRIAARVGVARSPDDGGDADTLLKHAEAALKKAKSSGDRYLLYTRKLTEAVAGKLTLENRLHQALDKDQFVLFYQPKLHLASGRITGVEALIRWNDPDAGLVLPERFISILEETGGIREVGRWVMRRAVEDYLRWRDAGLHAVRIAVNVSPLQLRNQRFVTEIEQVIGVDPRAADGLELEITESLVMEDIRHNIESLRAVRDLGVNIAIDDFGTGFSSLSYLAKLPVHTLKIDRSFVTDMMAGPEAITLVSTIIKLAHSMNLNVVAEGVETDQQSRLLRLLKCDEIQGYLAGKPVSRKSFEARHLGTSASAEAAGAAAWEAPRPALAGLLVDCNN
jgi:diguanylate cyclase (GGDEF)-like protein/PAS domain S-box-containing protein